MDPELNNLEADFNVRLDQWISKQGTVFQIKHAKGIHSLFPKLCVLAFKLLMVVVIVLAVFWFYLSNKASSDGNLEMVQGNIQNRFDASKVTVKSIRRVDKGIINGEMKISNIVMEESEKTFFSDWYVMEVEEDAYGRQAEVENKKHFAVTGVSLSPFGITDGVFSSGWKAREIDISTLACKLKVGADTDDEALRNYLQLFKKLDNISIDVITIREADIQWGYGADKGSILGSSIRAQYTNDVWELEIERGKFTHGWLKDAEIDKMKVVCYKDGRVEIKSAKLRIGGGSMEFSATITVKSKPEVKGEYSFVGVDVLKLVGKKYEEWFSGKIKGKGIISGEMNTQDGLKIETEVTLHNAGSLADLKKDDKKLSAQQIATAKESSRISLRGAFSLFEDVLRFRDTVHSYSLLSFDVGSFTVTQQGFKTSFNIPSMRQANFLIVEGSFTYNGLKASEIEKMESNINQESKLKEESASESTSESVEAFDLKFNGEEEMINRFSGELRIGFLPEVFEKYPEILAIYPMDIETARVWIPVKMEGGLDDLSSEIAEKLDKIIQKEEDKNK